MTPRDADRPGFGIAPPHAFGALAAAIAAALLLSACPQSLDAARTPAAGPPVARAPADQDGRPHTPTPDGYPELAPAEMGRRFLQLIDGLEWFNDLSSSRVAAAMRLPPFASSSSGIGSFVMLLPDSGWYYSIQFSDDPGSPNPLAADRSVAYEFDNRDAHADMGPVCEPDFDAYVDGLRRGGFARMPASYAVENGYPPQYAYYARKDVLVKLLPRPQAHAPGSGGRACVERIEVRREPGFCAIAPCGPGSSG
ncbi:hypothetical protein [Luteimonas aquatica]|uniref:hypothetical protein n=1 Tax=Luteimonas aquatica TaxID=450364 RepID=UPI001F5AAABB|nr:hypothetical protein [Luteimonas aquatica]